MSGQKKQKRKKQKRAPENDGPVLDQGFMDTPMGLVDGPEDDPDGFFDAAEAKSTSNELEALFDAPIDVTLGPSNAKSEKPGASSEDALQAQLDQELDALFDAPVTKQSPALDEDSRIVRPGDLLPEDEADLLDDEEASEAPEEFEPLGEEFEALFDDMREADQDSQTEETAQQIAPSAPMFTPGKPAASAASARSRQKPRQRDELDRVMHRSVRPRNRLRALLFWAVVTTVLAYVFYLPYDYEVGGEFTVQSGEISQVRSRTDGEIIKVSISEGEWVETDQIMAELSNWDEKRNIALREAEIERLNAELKTLLDGPRPEEIALKEQELTSRELMVQFAKSELERTEQLYESDTIPKKILDDRRDKLLLAESERDEAKIALQLLKSGARESDIAAARAQISQHEKELEYAQLQLEQTLIRAVKSGQVVSDMSKKPVGSYLPEGGLFAELEDNRVVFANIDVPETEIEEVELGAETELRLWSDSETRLIGTVYKIAPKAEERDFGKVIRVTVEVPNSEGRLASEMTGYAKIAAEERTVLEAFTRMIVLFFQIELWSWLP